MARSRLPPGCQHHRRNRLITTTIGVLHRVSRSVGFWQDVAVAGEEVADHEPRTTTVTVLFCDLVASTERAQLLGDDEADHFRRSFFERLRESAAATHGEVVKNIADGVMALFPDSA